MRHGMSFMECLKKCINETELVANYDTLRGTNISHRSSAIDLEIDRATGRFDAEIEGFIEFCWEYIFLRFGN
jgi:hypothetical protein